MCLMTSDIRHRSTPYSRIQFALIKTPFPSRTHKHSPSTRAFLDPRVPYIWLDEILLEIMNMASRIHIDKIC